MKNYRILIVRLSSLGDIVHTYPMIDDIKQKFPDCTIDWLVDENFSELVKLNTLVDKVVSIPLRNWKKNKFKLLSNICEWRKTLPNLTYDYIIDSQGLLKSALLAKCFKGPTYGLGINSVREKVASVFYKNKIETGKNHLAITKNRLLAAAIFNYEIDTSKAGFGLKNSKFNATGLDINSKYIIFFHATSKDSKKLNIQKWAELAEYLIKEKRVAIVLPYGSIREKEESMAIKELIKSTDVIVPVRKLDYKDLSQLIQSSEFVFGVDTGLIHLANALNKKLIAIYVDTNPEKTGIFESDIAKNIGNTNLQPTVKELIDLYENITKI